MLARSVGVRDDGAHPMRHHERTVQRTWLGNLDSNQDLQSQSLPTYPISVFPKKAEETSGSQQNSARTEPSLRQYEVPSHLLAQCISYRALPCSIAHRRADICNARYRADMSVRCSWRRARGVGAGRARGAATRMSVGAP